MLFFKNIQIIAYKSAYYIAFIWANIITLFKYGRFYYEVFPK